MSASIRFERTIKVGENLHGYAFFVGVIADEDRDPEDWVDRWCGFAVGFLRDGGRHVILFPQISDGALLGITNRDEAIRRTSAIALDPASGYGGIARWFVAEPLRAAPDDYRCEVCGEVCCDGYHDEVELVDGYPI